MGLKELKLNLHQLIDKVNNETVLRAHFELLSREADLSLDWWDTLEEKEQSSIDKGLAEIDNGDTVPHKVVMKVFDKWK